VFGQPFGGGFRAAAVHAGHVVHFVAGQRQKINDALGRHAEFFLHPGAVQGFAGHGVDQGDLGVDQLGHVLVASGHHHLPALRAGLVRQRANHVVGLDAFHHQQRPAQAGDGGVHWRDLRGQLGRHWRTLGFVLGVKLVAEGLAFCVKYDSAIIKAYVLLQLFQHVDHAVHRAGGFAGRRTQVRHGVECAVKIRRTIDQ